MHWLLVKIAQYQHRLLRLCSSSYRSHLLIVAERDRCRWDLTTVKNELAARITEINDLRADHDDLEIRLKDVMQMQEAAEKQLVAERALRQSADLRADRYHAELLETLKQTANWTSKSINRRAIFGDVADDTEPPPAKLTEMKPPKQMARQAAAAVTNATLKSLLDDIRAGRVEEEGQVGPEFGFGPV